MNSFLEEADRIVRELVQLGPEGVIILAVCAMSFFVLVTAFWVWVVEETKRMGRCKDYMLKLHAQEKQLADHKHREYNKSIRAERRPRHWGHY